MKNPMRLLVKAARLMRKNPLSAALALQRLAVSAIPAPKRPRVARKPPKPKPPAASIRKPLPAPGSFVDGVFQGATGKLSYKLYTPKGPAGRRLPLMVMLHGCSQTAADFAAGTGMNSLADEMGFLVLYPQQSAMANFNRCWNWHHPANRKRGNGETGMIAGLTRHVIAACKADPSRVYISGISAGGIAAAVTGNAYPEIYAAIGVHSGLVAGEIDSLRGALAAMRSGPAGIVTSKSVLPLPTIVFQGDRDKVVHPSNATGFVDLMRRSSAAPMKETVDKGSSASGRDYTRTQYRFGTAIPLLEQWMVHGNGHAWSGGQSAGSHTDPAGPDASRAMARFFLARKRAKPPRKTLASAAATKAR